jgi:hypothetical protein
MRFTHFAYPSMIAMTHPLFDTKSKTFPGSAMTLENSLTADQDASAMNAGQKLLTAKVASMMDVRIVASNN